MELHRVNKSLIMVLIEPKISWVKADAVCRKLWKSHWSEQRRWVLVGECGSHGTRKR